MRRLLAALSALLFVTLLPGTAQAAGTHRVIVYYQTQYNGGNYVSPLALTEHGTGVTDVIVGAIHLNDDTSVHLNDNPPSDPKFNQMWADLATMRGQGVHVLAFVGGAAQGSFRNLADNFDTFYPLLRNLVQTYQLSGLDLDVEEQMSNDAMNRLIDALHADFGDGFLITLAPVATELQGGGGLSGMDYDRLYRDRGAQISWFNTQFYCGWGSLQDTSGYDAIINHGVVPASKVVAGTVTNPGNCSGYVDMPALQGTLSTLAGRYSDFGGVDGWEYFNSLPGDTGAPWEWAGDVHSAMG